MKLPVGLVTELSRAPDGVRRMASHRTAWNAIRHCWQRSESHVQAEPEFAAGRGAGDRHEITGWVGHRSIQGSGCGEAQAAAPPFGLFQLGELVKLVDSARNSALTFSLILKFLNNAD